MEMDNVGFTLADRCIIAILCEYATVIFDHDRSPSLKVVHGFLDEVGVVY